MEKSVFISLKNNIIPEYIDLNLNTIDLNLSTIIPKNFNAPIK